MKRWKTLETSTAEVLGGRRIVEDWTLFNMRPDVVAPLPDGKRLVCDCKAYQRFSHHSLLNAVQAKYCTGSDVPCLVTKTPNQRGAYITLPIDFVSELLNHYRKANL